MCYVVTVAKQFVILLQWQSNVLHCYSGKAICYIVTVAKQCVTLLQWQNNVLHCCSGKAMCYIVALLHIRPEGAEMSHSGRQTDGHTYGTT